jgi:hypothetical protein
MAVQNRADNTNAPLILSGETFVMSQTIHQDAARAVPLLYGTVMGQIAATGMWEPWVNTAAVDGTQLPTGIYLGADIPAADLVDGDIEGKPILLGGCCTVDEARIVLDQDILDIDDAVPAITLTGRALLRSVGIFVEDTVDISEFEN